MKTLNPQVMRQQLMNDLETLNDKFYKESSQSVDTLIDLKVALHEHDKVLDDQIDDFKARIVSFALPLTKSYRAPLMATFT